MGARKRFMGWGSAPRSSSACPGRSTALMRVGGETMPELRFRTAPAPPDRALLGAEAHEKLERAAGAQSRGLRAELRVRAMDLTICSAAALVAYRLVVTPTRMYWQQRAVPFPGDDLLGALQSIRSWADATRRVCESAGGGTLAVGRRRFSVNGRACRVPVGVVAAEARGCERFFDLFDGEEGVYRISLAAAAIQLASGKFAAKAGRAMIADVERSRRPSHVPLFPLQRAFAKEVASGRSIDALCSRSAGIFDRAKSPRTELLRKLGVAATVDGGKSRRFARVVPSQLGAALCAVVDIAPEEVGL